MDKQTLEKLYLEQNLSQRAIAKKMNCSQSSIRHYLKKYNLKKHNSRSLDDQETQKLCSRCLQLKDYTEFYSRKNGKATSWCKFCNVENTLERQRLFKQKCIAYKGGCCESCGFNQYDGALEFHHKDPTKKDFNISRYRFYTDKSIEVEVELDKCALLCANCHRMIHGGIIQLS